MIFRLHDEDHTFPDCHRAGEGIATVDFNAASKDEDGHIRMIISDGSSVGKWGAVCMFMSPSEARDMASHLLLAAGEVEPHYAA